MNYLELILVFVIGFVGSFVGSVAAGASLVTVPALLLLGIPPQIALGSAKFGILGLKIGSLIKFLKHKILIRNLILPMSVLGLVGSAIGARLFVEIDENVLAILVGILLIILLPFLFLKRGVGTSQVVISSARRKVSHLMYFLVSALSGFFSPGSGFFALYVTLNGYGLTILQAKATVRVPEILATLSAVAVFAVAGFIDYTVGVILLIGMLVGGYVGSHVAIEKGNAWIKPIMAAFIVFVGIKLIFF